MARMMLPFLTKQLQPFTLKGFPPLVLSQSRTAAAAAVVPASYSDGAYFGTGAPSYSGNTVSITATHAGGANNVACIFLHYDAGLVISGITFDGAAATIVTVSFATSVQGVVAYAPCSSGGSHTWAVTFTSTPSAGAVQGTTVTMTGVTSTPSQTAVQSWGTYNPETTGSITVSAGGIAMTFLATASTGGTWSGATEITTTSASFPLAYSTGSDTVSYAVAGSGSQMATLSWDAASGGTSSTGTGAATEDTDTTAASGTVAIAITGASTEAADTTAASGTASVSGSGASTEGTDTASGVATASVSGSGASTEGSDSGGGVGAVSAAASGASTEATDTTSGTGTVSIAGNGADAETSDTTSGAGAVAVAASGAATEGTDNGSGSGTVAQPGSTGTGAAVETNDTTSGVGLTLVSGTGSALETADTCAGTGSTLSISFGHIKLWMGTGFAAKPVKVWNGIAWVEKPLKYWTGAAWRATSY